MTTEVFAYKNLIFITGLAHFCQVPALFFAPKMLNWKAELDKLAPINARIYVVMGIGITVAILGLGAMVMATASELAAGGRLAAGVHGFLAVFWAYRAGVQLLVYPRIWPGGLVGRCSHYGLTALLIYLTLAYSVFFVVSVG